MEGRRGGVGMVAVVVVLCGSPPPASSRPTPAMQFSVTALQGHTNAPAVTWMHDGPGEARRTPENCMEILKMKLMGVWRLLVRGTARLC